MDLTKCQEATQRWSLEIRCRRRGLAMGLGHGVHSRRDAAWAVECLAAHSALVVTTHGNTSPETLEEVEKPMQGVAARLARLDPLISEGAL